MERLDRLVGMDGLEGPDRQDGVDRLDILGRLDVMGRLEGLERLGCRDILERQDWLDGLESLERPDRMDLLDLLDRQDGMGRLERQALVEVGDLYFPFRMCYWFSFCDVLAVVPEPITHVGGVCCYDHAVHVFLREFLLTGHQTFTG